MSTRKRIKSELRTIKMWYETSDGFVLQLTNSVSDLLAWSGMGAAGIQQITAVGANQNGVTLLDQFLNERFITLTIKRLPCDCYGLCAGSVDQFNQTRYDLRPFRNDKPNQCPAKQMGRHVADAIITNILRNRGDAGILWVEFFDGTRRGIHLWPDILPPFNFSQGDGSRPEAVSTVRMLAPNPTFFSEEITDIWIGSTVKRLKTCGTQPSYPTIILQDAFNEPQINNTDTGRIIKLNYNSVNGETITITLGPDTANRTRKTVVSSINGNIIGVVDSVTDLTEFAVEPSPKVPRGENDLFVFSLGGDIGRTVTAIWRERYTGVIL